MSETKKQLNAKDVLELIREEKIEFVDFRFTDPRGKWHHTAQHASTINEESLEEGVMFDGSSISGWKSINESDMILMPDCSTAMLDPFASQPLLILICDILEPSTGSSYDLDPRSVAKKAETYIKSTGIADTAYIGSEPEFFIFDDVRFNVSMDNTFYKLDSDECPASSAKEVEGGNHGHRPREKGGYFPVAPVDSATDLRAEMVSVMREMGIDTEKHHHEVAPSQHEIGYKFGTLTSAGDALQIAKYAIHNTAHAYGKTATFMPKPMFGDNGSGLHSHHSLWKDGKPLFAGSGYADLSDKALYYIGGIIKHAKALNAFTNASTNSYKRLIPGFEAPVLLAYSARNRSAALRIPYSTSPNAKRIEVRFPDSSANPYLSFAAMMMAGIDGIENKIHPGDPMDKNLYDLPAEELKEVPTVCHSLREALDSLEKDCDFLKKGDVFTEEMLESYIKLKWEEVYNFEHTPHPMEFKMYYSV